MKKILICSLIVLYLTAAIAMGTAFYYLEGIAGALITVSLFSLFGALAIGVTIDVTSDNY